MQFVIVSLSGWGLLIFGGYKFFTRGKGNKEEVHVLNFSVQHYLFSACIIWPKALNDDKLFHWQELNLHRHAYFDE